MIAVASRMPEAGLTADESRAIATAADQVARHYDIGVNSLAFAWGNLAVTCGSIAAGKYFAYKSRMAKEKATQTSSAVPLIN